MSATGLRHPGLNLGPAHGDAHEAAEEIVFGFWVFLMSDLVLFSAIFATFATMVDATAGGPDGHTLFDFKSAAIETGALLLSSFTFGMASVSMKHGRETRSVALWLGVTLLLAFVFLGLEINDFLSMLAKGGSPERSGFLSAVWLLVATHGTHVTFGCLWIVVMLIQVLKLGLTSDVKLRLLRLALFWHFLDIVWVGIFSFVYLRGLA